MIKNIPENAFARASRESWNEFVQRAQITGYESALLFPVNPLRSSAFVDTGFMRSVHIRRYTLDDNVGSSKASRTKMYLKGLKEDIRKNGLVRAVGLQSDKDGKKIRVLDGTHRIWIFHQLFEETSDDKWAWIRTYFNQDYSITLKLLIHFERMFQFKLDTDFIIPGEE